MADQAVLTRSPEADEARAAPGTWWIEFKSCSIDGSHDGPCVPDRSKPTLMMRCPLCGHAAALRGTYKRADGTYGHTVTAAGVVAPSIVCPHPGCTWHVWGTLEGWTGFP